MHEDIEVILKIPLLRIQKENELLWHYDKQGEYSMKSAFQIALKIKAPNVSSSSKSNSKRWNILWSLELLEKIKIFIWKVAKNLLPTAAILWRRKCLKDSICESLRGRWKLLTTPFWNAKQQKKYGFMLFFQFKLKMAQTKTFSALSTICALL